MDLKAVGQRIKAAREAKNLTQEELAALVNLSPTHVSVIERGLKVTKLDTFRLNHKFCGISDSSRSSVGSYRIASERNIRHQDIRIPVCEES